MYAGLPGIGLGMPVDKAPPAPAPASTEYFYCKVISIILNKF